MKSIEKIKKRVEEIKKDLLISVSSIEDTIQEIEDNESQGGYSGITRNLLGQQMEELEQWYSTSETNLNNV